MLDKVVTSYLEMLWIKACVFIAFRCYIELN